MASLSNSFIMVEGLWIDSTSDFDATTTTATINDNLFSSRVCSFFIPACFPSGAEGCSQILAHSQSNLACRFKPENKGVMSVVRSVTGSRKQCCRAEVQSARRVRRASVMEIVLLSFCSRYFHHQTDSYEEKMM